MSNYEEGIFYFKRAETNRDNREFNKAIELFSQAESKFRFINTDTYYRPRIFLGRAFCYREIGKHDNAIIDCDAALKINPNNEWGWAMRGASNIETGNYDKALEDLSIAIELNPQYDWAWELRGYLYSLQWKLNLSIADFNKALELNPNLSWVSERLEMIRLYLDSFKKDVKGFQAAVIANPGNSISVENLGDLNLTKCLKFESKLWVWEISHNGQFIVLGFDNGRILLWDIHKWQQIKELHNEDFHIRCMKLAKNNTNLIIGSNDGRIRFWDLKKSTIIGNYSLGNGISDNLTKNGVANLKLMISSIDISQDGNLACVLRGHDGTIEIINLITKEIEAIKPTIYENSQGNQINAIFSNDGRNLYVLDYDFDDGSDEWVYSINKLEAKSGKLVEHLLTRKKGVFEIKYSGNKSGFLLSDCPFNFEIFDKNEGSHKLEYWTLKSHKQKCIVELHESLQKSLTHKFSWLNVTKIGDKALTICGEYLLGVWNLKKAALNLYYRPNMYEGLLYDEGYPVAISPKGDYAFLSSDDSFYLWKFDDLT